MVHIKRGSYSAEIEAVRWSSDKTLYRITVSRNAVILYEQLEQQAEDAKRMAEAYLDWEQAHARDRETRRRTS